MSGDAHYYQHWDEKFKSRGWGRYPSEDLVRFMGRNYGSVDRSKIKVLEVGCGTGANLWFLHREGYQVSGIDGSESGVKIARERLETENKGLNPTTPDLRVGNFSKLPWSDQSFDVVVDIFSIYANTLSVIDSTLGEIHRVLKPGGRFYSKVWGKKCTGFGTGKKIEEGTFDEIPDGPFKDMGLSHFFDRNEIPKVYHRFQVQVIDEVIRTETAKRALIEEYWCSFTKEA